MTHVIQLFPGYIQGRDGLETEWRAVLFCGTSNLELRTWLHKAEALAWCEELKALTGWPIFFNGAEWL